MATKGDTDGNGGVNRRGNGAVTGGMHRADLPMVLMYHSVCGYRHDPYLVTVCPDRFARQMAWLRRHGLRGVSIRDLLDAHRAGRPRGLVGLTFDDGYADFLANALPVLRHHGFTATVFALAGRLGGDNAWDEQGPRKPLLTADALRRVAAAGMEIGSHGWAHVPLPETGENGLVQEIEASRPVLSELAGGEVRGFCYPYGEVSGEVAERVRDAGYDYACAIWRSNLTGIYALPRIYVGDADSGLRLEAKRFRHRLVSRHPRFDPALRRIPVS
jgi:peptidoglycan/xylan/chitin deacetylase (PgdA/CDA1 family)